MFFYWPYCFSASVLATFPEVLHLLFLYLLSPLLNIFLDVFDLELHLIFIMVSTLQLSGFVRTRKAFLLFLDVYNTIRLHYFLDFWERMALNPKLV